MQNLLQRFFPKTPNAVCEFGIEMLSENTQCSANLVQKFMKIYEENADTVVQIQYREILPQNTNAVQIYREILPENTQRLKICREIPPESTNAVEIRYRKTCFLRSMQWKLGTEIFLRKSKQVSDSGLRDQAKHHQVLQRQKDTEKDRETQRSDAAAAVACCTVIAWTVCA
jgi:hypothetical protein